MSIERGWGRRPWRPLDFLRPSATTPTIPRTGDEAKERVLAHWDQMNALCARRFPNNENLAHEGLLYVLEKLEANDWERVRKWEGQGNFVTFLMTLAARLLTDFSRSRYGHIRMPQWLADKADPVWHAAYRLVIVERLSRQEAIESLVTSEPSRERWAIEEAVASVRARCSIRTRPGDVETGLDDHEVIAGGATPDDELAVAGDEVAEALVRLLDDDLDEGDPGSRVGELVERLRAHVALNDEERVMLRLRYLNGVKMTEIVKLLGMTGDPYKRYHKLLARLRKACDEAGLTA